MIIIFETIISSEYRAITLVRKGTFDNIDKNTKNTIQMMCAYIYEETEVTRMEK